MAWYSPAVACPSVGRQSQSLQIASLLLPGSVTFIPEFSAFSVIFFRTLAFTGGSAGLVSLGCCKRLPSVDFFALFVFILSGMIDVSVLALFLGEEGTSKLSSFMIFTSCPELLSLLFRELLFAELLSSHSHPEHLDWRKSSLLCSTAMLLYLL